MEEQLELLLKRLSNFLDTYTGRDKAIRTVYFSLLLLANRMNDQRHADQLAAFAKQFSRTRLVCRLFSQPSLLLSTLQIPRQWRASIDSTETILSSCTTLLYLTCGWSELIGWLTESGLLFWLNKTRNGMQQATNKWFQHSLRLWVLALLVSLVRSTRHILLRLHRDQQSFCHPTAWNKAQRLWLREQLIGLVGTGVDFCAAVNSLPVRLWAGRLNGTQSASLFLLASLIGVYRLW